MRFLPAIFLIALSAHAAENTYPLWDGEESIEQYAERANLPPTQTVDLGNRVKMEFVLVPAGSFQQGLQTPSAIQAHYPSVDWLVVFLGIVGLLIAIVQVVRRFRHRRSGGLP